MSDRDQCTDMGCMTPAQVVQCAEGSNKVCWIAATVVGADGAQESYECCGGGGTKASFSRRRGSGPAKPVSPADVPDGLTWSRRITI